MRLLEITEEILPTEQPYFMSLPDCVEEPDSYLNMCHSYTRWNKSELDRAQTCGCFVCQKIYIPSSDIVEWIDSYAGLPNIPILTAICPYCAHDSVMPSIMPNFIVTTRLLELMNMKFAHLYNRTMQTGHVL